MKQGFTLPLGRWMRSGLRDFCGERLGSTGLAGRGIFRPGEVERLWQSFRKGEREIAWSRLWTLVALEEWLERNGVAE